MKNIRYASIYLAFIGLVSSVLACNVPTSAPQTPSPSVVPVTPSALPPQETPLPSATPAPLEATSTPTPQVATEIPIPTVTKLPTPASPTDTPPTRPTLPGSAGPLDFPEPTALDNWQPMPDGGWEVTIILRITGGAPPYTVHHDLDVLTTWESDPAIVFTARDCGAVVHTIIVESADGQSVKHDYWIPPPWCQ